MPHAFVIRCTVIVGLATALNSGSARAEADGEIVFNRDIRPILSDRCFRCHGPDSASRQADLRLDQSEAAVASREGGAAIVPGHADRSSVYRRITSADADERMPPADSGLKLTGREAELLKRWIDAGAEYQPHWSFIAPVRPKVPPLPKSADARNPIDHFVRARLAAQKLKPSAEADKPTLIRRVTFDLTGLPPTLSEIDAFLADESPDAYERVVDRLLASPRYGERMATPWLDAARYADTNGYQSDEARHMWRWRDWVIDAFNRNLPFDQFTIEQLAGDLLPNATLDQKIATGFNRNHRANSEGGIIPEEFLVEYAVDRLDTTATVWLGLTIGCARCHDHKYDPVTQRDFYRLMAFFNNVPEQGKVSRTGNSTPTIEAPTPDLAAELRTSAATLAKAEKRWRGKAAEVTAAQGAWEKTIHGRVNEDIVNGLVAHMPLDGDTVAVQRKPRGEAARIEGKPVDGSPKFAAGQIDRAAALTGGSLVEFAGVGEFKETEKFSFGAWVWPDGEGTMGVVSKMDEDESYAGWGLSLADGRAQAELVNRVLDDSIRVETVQPIEPRRWHHLLVAYEGTRNAYGVRIYVDGKVQKTNILSNSLSLPIKNTEPLRLGARGRSHRFRGRIDDVRLYNRSLSADEAANLASTETIDQIAKIPAGNRTPAQAGKVHAYFLKHDLPKKLAKVYAALEAGRKSHKELEQSIPTTMVMQEKPERSETFVLMRGQYDKPGERVEPGVPASLHPLDVSADGASQRADRLMLGRWLASPANPLTARVTVNRFWQMYFGTGLVKTAEDFGSQGEVPRYQELLDWLACEFIASGWDVKAMQRLVVTSATYRQSSSAPAAAWARDPENRLLARGPRQRLSAEMIRDSALATSGLLVEHVGGPSVKPYQPPGLYEELKATVGAYVEDTGESQYRRSMYTFWKRTIPAPNMMVFDAAGREVCTVRRSCTNTPLQALALLNDVPYVEAARGLGQRMMLEGGKSPDDRIVFAFRLETARRPRDVELAILRAGFDRNLAQYREYPEAAAKLLTIGHSPRAEGLDAAELAAYSLTASVILNTDEAITKE